MSKPTTKLSINEQRYSDIYEKGYMDGYNEGFNSAMALTTGKQCHWIEPDPYVTTQSRQWKSECEQLWDSAIINTLLANHIEFCPKCGNPVKF